MCKRTVCARCEKPTFAGCGRHVEQVLADVPEAQRCRCREAPAPDAAEVPSFLGRVFRRGS